MLSLGTSAPDFSLPDCSGGTASLSEFKGAPALLVIFMCNHCPYVKHVLGPLVELAREYKARGTAVVAISSNDIENYPEDSPEMMAQLAAEADFEFAYLYDEDQEIAKAYRAACTPDFYVFDEGQKLVYRGQMDDSRPGNDVPVTGADLRQALNAVLAGEPVPADQRPSLGCNVKWKPGNEPEYA
jgi:peroxiredoxin